MICPECGKMPLDAYGMCPFCTAITFLADLISRQEMTAEEVLQELDRLPNVVSTKEQDRERLYKYTAWVREAMKHDPHLARLFRKKIQ